MTAGVEKKDLTDEADVGIEVRSEVEERKMDRESIWLRRGCEGEEDFYCWQRFGITEGQVQAFGSG